MLTKVQLDSYRKALSKGTPIFDGWMNSDPPELVIETPDENSWRNNERFHFANSIEQLPGCCGILVLHGLRDRLSVKDLAALAIWLHQPHKEAMILASTAKGDRKKTLSQTEKDLVAVGFLQIGEPTVNKGTRNLITLWCFK